MRNDVKTFEEELNSVFNQDRPGIQDLLSGELFREAHSTYCIRKFLNLNFILIILFILHSILHSRVAGF
jgi:hypothetical protein